MTAPQSNSSSSSTVRFGQPSGGPSVTPGFGRVGAIIGIVLALGLVGGLLWAAAAGQTVSAQQPHLFGGSLVLEDAKAPTVIDVATGQVEVKLTDIGSQVGHANPVDVQAVPVQGGTMLIDRGSGKRNDPSAGTFNLLGQDNYVVDRNGAGVTLQNPPRGMTGASGYADGAMVYIVRYGPGGTVSLVDEATVAAAAAKQKVNLKGFDDLGTAVSDQPGVAAVAGGDLWILAGSGSSCRVVQEVPVAIGHQGLLSTVRANVPSKCTEVAAEAASGVVSVAYPGHVRLFLPGGSGSGVDVAVGGTANDSRFRPVTGTSGTLWFLAGGGQQGWSVFGVTPDGRVTVPSSLRHFGLGTLPATPVLSDGMLYTLDQNADQPVLWQIVPSSGAMTGVKMAKGTTTYPVLTVEKGVQFENAQVLVDGPRVVFNNPSSLQAVMVFTDDSQLPHTINKYLAVSVSASGPADVSGSGSGSKAKGQQQSGNNVAPPVQPVNPNVTCANTTQKPYSPQITSVDPASESAVVKWSYQLLEQQDCEPDSWSVTVNALNGPQPAQPQQDVNGQEQLQFTGLRPATTYNVVVAAYINSQSTASSPSQFTTEARGPDAPTAVQTTSDGKGNWIVSWTPCTTGSCYVPAGAWNVIGTACGSSFVGQPPSVQVAGGQTTATISANALGLLGDSLSFSVQGVLNSGLTGESTSDHACTQAWQPPNPAAITLAASGQAVGQTITATLQVSTGATSAVQAFGSQQTEFVYTVGGVTVGPTTSENVTVPGLPAGQQYTPTVSIYPAGHPAASVTVTGPTFQTNLSWPTNALMTAVGSVSTTNPALGNLTLQFTNLPTAVPSGQLSATGTLTCGSTSEPISGLVVGGQLVKTNQYDLYTVGTGCTVNGVSVTDTATPNPYGTSLLFPTFGPFSFGTQPPYTFSSAWGALDCTQTLCAYPVTISYTGAGTPSIGINWTVTVTGLAGTTPISGCAATSGPSATAPFPLTVSLAGGCSGITAVTATVTWTYLGVATTVSVAPPTGPPPSTTTTTTTTTTSTTTPTSSTAPCSSTTPSTTCDSSGGSSQDASAQLAVASQEHPLSAVAPPVKGDADVRIALESIFLMVAAACCYRVGLGLRRRRHQTKQHRKEPG